MRARRLAIAFLLAAALAPGTPARAGAAERAAIDPQKSSAQFRIGHIFVSHVVGTIPIVSGSVVIASGSPIPLSVTAVLDPARVHTDDPDRDKSLASADYFDAATFPTWTFTSTSIVASGAAAFTMDGDLTIHGVTQPEHLDVTVAGDAAHPTYHAVGRIDRHAFGMKGARLDPVIGNPAEITLDITLQ